MILKDSTFIRQVYSIAIPVALQGLLQASFGLVDQIMVGQLGSGSIAAIGIANKFPALYLTVLAAITSAASVMFAQYHGTQNSDGIGQSFRINTYLSAITMLIFLIPSIVFPALIVGIYTTDGKIIPIAAQYLEIIGIGYLPLMGTFMLSALMRNIGYAKYPMISGIVSVAMNTVLNYMLIFGKIGFPEMGVAGSGLATTISRFFEFLVLSMLYLKIHRKKEFRLVLHNRISASFVRQAFVIVIPLLASEILWGLGETLYGVVYGRIGTDQMAAMTLTGPVQDLLYKLFFGLTVAAGVIAGEYLGKNEYQKAYDVSGKLLKFGTLSAMAVGVLLALSANLYVRMFNVTPDTLDYTVKLLWVFAGMLFVKMFNLILTCGTIQSGGETKYALILNTIGTWGVGIPLGFFTAFMLHFPIHWVYFCICLEECLRMILGIRIFLSKRWMKNITQQPSLPIKQSMT